VPRPSRSSGQRLILHIGLPKSGSSAIQAYLADNATRLAESGLGWLPGMRGPNATELAVAFSHRDNVISAEYGVRNDHDRLRLLDRIADRLRRRADHDVLISSEHLAGLLRTSAETGDLATFLSELGFQPMIIGVIDPAAVPRRFLHACGVPMETTAAWPRPDRLSRPGLSATAVEVLRRISPALELQKWTSGADRERLVNLLAERHPDSGVRLTPAADTALTRRGWVRTGVDTGPAAYGSGWQQLRDEEPAQIEDAAQPSSTAIGATLLAARAAGLGRRSITRRARALMRRLRS